jgi:tRNA pseudouridine38-40 synthase
MHVIKLTISYDGTAYSGWQIQPNGVTIQELIQKAVREMTGEENNVVGAGRTDAGVHAFAQVASFRTERDISTDGFWQGLNSSLPPDIRIVVVEEASESFHPIRDSKSKHYRYIISVGGFEDPLNLNRSWFMRRPFDLELMNQAAGCLVGEQDFSAFRASDASGASPVKSVFSAHWNEEKLTDKYINYYFEIKGNGFLKNMVRNIVGTLVDVGLKKITPDDFKNILDSKDRKKAGICAPASGLYLVSVEY